MFFTSILNDNNFLEQLYYNQFYGGILHFKPRLFDTPLKGVVRKQTNGSVLTIKIPSIMRVT